MKFILDHMCSNVKDIKTTMAFYEDVVGGKVVDYTENKTNNSKRALVQIADGFFELTEPGVHDENTPYGLKHIAFRVDDLDAAYSHLVKMGFAFRTLPKVGGSGNGRLAFFTDTNGIVVELLQRDVVAELQDIESPIIKSFDHYAIMTDDITAAFDLYHGFMKMNPLAHFMVDAHKREIMYLDHGSVSLEIYTSPTIKNPKNPHAHISLRVEEITKAVADLTARGATFAENAINTPGIKFGMSASFYDPDGVRIELVDRPSLHDFEKLGINPDTLPAMRKF